MKAILWDFDGTLGWRDGGWTAAVTDAILALRPGDRIGPDDVRPHLRSGFPWHSPEVTHTHIATADAWWAHLGATVLTPLREALGLGDLASDSLVEQVRRIYCAPDNWHLFPDALPTLRRLRQLGWSNRILSNHVPELPALLAQLGLDGAVDSVNNSAETGYEKPNVCAFQCALGLLPKAADVWMVGDSIPADVRGAERAGLRAVLARRTSAEVRWSVEGLAEIVDIVESALSST